MTENIYERVSEHKIDMDKIDNMNRHKSKTTSSTNGTNFTAVLRYLLCKKNEPELSLHFLVTSYDGQGHVWGLTSGRQPGWLTIYCQPI